MTLELPNNIGIAASQEAQAHATWDTYQDVEMWLSLNGINVVNKPPFERPVIDPADYANLEGARYSILMGQVDRWFEYATSLQASFKGRLIAVRNEMDFIGVDYRAGIRRMVEGGAMKKPTVAEMEDAVKEIPRYRELTLNEQNLKIAMEQNEAMILGLERYARGLSRQVTVRGQEIELSNADGNKRPPRTFR